MSRENHIMIFVPGILTMPGDARDWNIRAIRWTHLNTYHRADDVEYFTFPGLQRLIGQRARVRKFAAVLSSYAANGFKITLVGHSNGCAVILDGLKSAHWPRVEALHLVCGACESNFDKNGLNHAIQNLHVGHVFVYRGGRDWALRLANTALGRFMGYGTLGLTGAKFVFNAIKHKVCEVEWLRFGHSDCWNQKHFDGTMRHFNLPKIINHQL